MSEGATVYSKSEILSSLAPHFAEA